MSNLLPTIGLEIHAELKTITKMFCRCKNDPDEERPNTNICPVCLAHPGTLPVINKQAIKHVLKVGIALGGKLAEYTEFDRKSYFYPDLPKGYQISQYEFPLVSGGFLNDVAITRVHLEEDTASSTHDALDATLIDFNRSSVPLMELVTEPVIHSSKEAGDFARELQLLLRTLGVSDANMEKGEMRVEANVSMAPEGKLGTKVEIKNLNSFRIMERAVEYEISRQKKLIEKGDTIVQETRGWHEGRQETFAQRIKEGSADYRYFPDPDLPSLFLPEIKEFDADILRAEMPELPSQRRARYVASGIKLADAVQYAREPAFTKFIDAVLELCKNDKDMVALCSNYIGNDIVKLWRDKSEETGTAEILISPDSLVFIIRAVGSKKLSSRGAKDLIAVCYGTDNDPDAEARSRNLYQDSSVSVDDIAKQVAQGNAKAVDEYRAGKITSLQFLVGQGMKASGGRVDPSTLREAIIKAIDIS